MHLDHPDTKLLPQGAPEGDISRPGTRASTGRRGGIERSRYEIPGRPGVAAATGGGVGRATPLDAHDLTPDVVITGSIAGWIRSNRGSLQSRSQTVGVLIVHRHRSYIIVNADSSGQSNWIALDISTKPGVVLPMPILIQPRLLIEHLPRESRVIDERTHPARILVRRCGPERLSRVPAPHQRVVLFRHHPHRIDVVRVSVLDRHGDVVVGRHPPSA